MTRDELQQKYIACFMRSAENRFWFEVDHPELKPNSPEFEAALKAEAIECFNWGTKREAIALPEQPPF